jgi:two-component system OmpR family response regulator
MPRIMLIEANPETRHVAADVLQHAQYEVETCAEAGAAFARACQERPDLVILDVPAHQPRVGYQVLDRLKQQEETQAIPVLLAVPTPDVLTPDQQVLAERGVHVLPQPIASTELIHRVEDMLGSPAPVPELAHLEAKPHGLHVQQRNVLGDA